MSLQRCKKCYLNLPLRCFRKSKNGEQVALSHACKNCTRYESYRHGYTYLRYYGIFTDLVTAEYLKHAPYLLVDEEGWPVMYLKNPPELKKVLEQLKADNLLAN